MTVIGLALICTISGCSRDEYSAEPIEARVVDADSGAPLEGVNIIAAWELKGGLEGGNIEGYLEVLEAVTDSKGMFHIPAWGPKVKQGHGGFEEAAPVIMVFKPGYEYRSVANKRPPRGIGPMRSDWDSKTITLTRFDGTPAEYKEKLIWLRTDLGALHSIAGDYWPQIPNFLCAGARFERELAVHGVAATLPRYEELTREKGSLCETRPATGKEQRK